MRLEHSNLADVYSGLIGPCRAKLLEKKTCRNRDPGRAHPDECPLFREAFQKFDGDARLKIWQACACEEVIVIIFKPLLCDFIPWEMCISADIELSLRATTRFSTDSFRKITSQRSCRPHLQVPEVYSRSCLIRGRERRQRLSLPGDPSRVSAHPPARPQCN